MEEQTEAERAKLRPKSLTALQEQLVWALLQSGLSRDILVQAIGELERDRANGERRERGDGESSEEGEMDFSPPIFKDLEKLPSEQASKLRAEVEQLLQYVKKPNFIGAPLDFLLLSLRLSGFWGEFKRVPPFLVTNYQTHHYSLDIS